MYGPSSTQELYKSSESLSQWLTTGKATPKLPNGRNKLLSASSGNLIALPVEKLKTHGSTASVNSIPPKLPKRPTPRPSVTSVDFGSPRPSVTSLDIVTMSSLDDLDPNNHLTTIQQKEVAFVIAVMFCVVISLITLALASVSISFSMTQSLTLKRAVAAHLLIDVNAFAAARDNVERIEPLRNMSSCAKFYELKHWHTSSGGAMLHGVTYNKTNSRLTVQENGIYSVYSQVVFDEKPPKKDRDPYSDSLIHVLCRAVPELGESDEDLAQATSTPNQVDCSGGGCSDSEHAAFHTSHVIGVAKLQRGDEIYVKVSSLSVVQLSDKARVTFIGLFKVD